MARTTDWNDYAARSMRNRREDSRGKIGQRQSLQRDKSEDEGLHKALATVRRAFPTLFDDLCESCRSLMESRITRFAEGGISRSSAQSKSFSHNTSSDQQHFSASDLNRDADSPSTNALNSSSNHRKESFGPSEERECYEQCVNSEESYSSSYVNAESLGKGSGMISWESTRKKLDYLDNAKEQYEEPTSWPALGSSNRHKPSIPERLQHEEIVKQNGEPIYNVKPAPWSNRNSQHRQGSQETVAPYRNALKKVSNSSSCDTNGTIQSGSRDSIHSDSVWKSNSNNSASERAILSEANEGTNNGLEEDAEQREWMRFQEVVAKKDFEFYEHVNGRTANILEGLELHTNVLNTKEQEKLVAFALELQNQGRHKGLMGRTYSEPRKWMRGKGRVTIQFGCCYNYALDKAGNPPGIVRDETVDPLPKLLKAVIRRLIRWHVLPPSCVPDSCIINIYDEGDCIPPHIDHHDFVRPFCTLSLLSECNIVFGPTLKILGPGEFEGSVKIPLPVGSVLVLNGNGADVAKHAVPAVPTKRISITFRKMDPLKVPYGFVYEKDLQNLTPL